MDWIVPSIVAGAFIAFILLKRMSFVSPQKARDLLQAGALVVDVREPGEFRSGHVKAAVNVPLGTLGQSLPRRVPDKNQVLLLHCLSGTRSGIARRQLADMGYRNVFNLGSYGRAKRIVGNPR